jgi:hypothetical protein
MTKLVECTNFLEALRSPTDQKGPRPNVPRQNDILVGLAFGTGGEKRGSSRKTRTRASKKVCAEKEFRHLPKTALVAVSDNIFYLLSSLYVQPRLQPNTVHAAHPSIDGTRDHLRRCNKHVMYLARIPCSQYDRSLSPIPPDPVDRQRQCRIRLRLST